MEYKINNLPHSEIEIEVTIPFPEFEPHVKRAAVLISEETEIEGFRKGKAPFEVVKDRIGESAIYERAANVAIRKNWKELFDSMVEKKELSRDHVLIGQPEITVTKLAPGNELQFKIKSAVLPDVKLPDYRALAKQIIAEKKEVAVEESEIEDALNWLRDSRTKLITVDRAAASGDRIEVDYEIRQGGTKIENGESRNHPFILGQGKFLPGFEEAVVGLKTGEEKKFTLDIPKDWHETSLAGKAFDFSVKMRLVQERQMPEATDEFAKSLGSFESLEALRKNISEGLLTEKKDKEEQRVKGAVVEKIAQGAEVDIPEMLITSEIKKMKEELQGNLSQYGMKWSEYLVHIKKSETDLEKDWQPEATRRVRVALCLRSIAKEEDVTVSEEEINEKANQYLERFGGSDEAKKAIDPDALREYARGVVRNEKVFNLLVKQ